MKTILASLILNTVTILLIAYLLPGIIWVKGLGSAIWAALLLGLVNAILRPILVRGVPRYRGLTGRAGGDRRLADADRP